MLQSRRIANREQRPNRIMGFEWGELRSFLLTPAICYLAGTPWLFTLIMSAAGVIVTLVVSRRFPAGSLADYAAYQVQQMRHGHHAFGARRTDPTLRDGDPLIPRR